MIKIFSYKCIVLAFFTLTSTICADNHKSFKFRSLGEVSKVKESKNYKKKLLNRVDELIGDGLDLEYFNKKKLGWSVYGRISKVSKIGLRYNY